MDRRAAQEAFVDYLNDKNFTADQIQFVKYIIDHFSKNGVVEPNLLYERPFTDRHEEGIDGLFAQEQADSLLEIIKTLNSSVQPVL